MEQNVKLILKNDFSELQRLAVKLEEMESSGLLPGKHLFNINLALDELVTNIISYGYEDESIHEISIGFNFDNCVLEIILEDDGLEFNPLLLPEPDINQPLEERKIGGLGIHFVRELMDGVKYNRNNGKNILTILKNLN